MSELLPPARARVIAFFMCAPYHYFGVMSFSCLRVAPAVPERAHTLRFPVPEMATR
jgi:hypothetical protein